MHPKKANVELTLILFAEYTFDKKELLSPQRGKKKERKKEFTSSIEMKALSPSGVRMYCVKALSKEDKLS
ncbi:hypothetical protein NC653_041854 [Populus alba x Populus x berolinensis]|uniref:Uncharacterized protein n=1 Tax=Populus alba x Populus x berolinensis TaxID=444605 RepID=A0AAD6PPP7_9ROSI|nr:hypothetical protein NC653_041854 [Populus alba x Populus x berolinensis]